MQNSIWIYRLFDVAGEIKLDVVEKILSHDRQTSRMVLSRTRPKSIQLTNPPVAVELGEHEVSTGVRKLHAAFTAKIYDLGVIGIIMRIPLAGYTQYEEIRRLALELYNSEAIEQYFLQQLANIRKALSRALVNEEYTGFVEDFIIYYFRNWQKDWDPAPLLLAEDEPLSPEMHRETLRNSFSYGLEDLAIITWDSALVYDAAGSTDIPDLLEFANSQLLELRYYDSLLSGEMEKMYEAIEAAGQAGIFRQLNQYRRIMNQLAELIVDITEITERIDNSLKVTEDVFYARVYGTALSTFRTRTWAESINRKISIITQNYTMLSNRLVNRRSELLELTIIILIGFEIILGIAQSLK